MTCDWLSTNRDCGHSWTVDIIYRETGNYIQGDWTVYTGRLDIIYRETGHYIQGDCTVYTGRLDSIYRETGQYIQGDTKQRNRP